MLKTSFIGRLGADAETFNGKNGQFLSFRVATDDYYKGENTTVWVNVTINQDRVGNMKLTKGSHVFITGSLRVSTYQTKSGETAVSIDVMGDSISFVRSGGSGNTDTTTVVTEQAVSTGTLKKKPVVADTTVTKEPEDDLPF